MKIFDWDKEKNEWLKKERKISFEIVLEKISNNKIIDILHHSNKEKYFHQKLFIIEHENYIYTVPFVEDEGKIFLKTIIPSRKLTKQYLKEKQ